MPLKRTGAGMNVRVAYCGSMGRPSAGARRRRLSCSRPLVPVEVVPVEPAVEVLVGRQHFLIAIAVGGGAGECVLEPLGLPGVALAFRALRIQLVEPGDEQRGPAVSAAALVAGRKPGDVVRREIRVTAPSDVDRAHRHPWRGRPRRGTAAAPTRARRSARPSLPSDRRLGDLVVQQERRALRRRESSAASAGPSATAGRAPVAPCPPRRRSAAARRWSRAASRDRNPAQARPAAGTWRSAAP